MTRKLNAESEQQMKQWEALVLFAYDDFDPPTRRRKIKVGDKVYGTLTVGYGHTGPDVRPGLVITKGVAEELFDRDVGEAAAAVENAVKVPLNDNQFGALVSFAYNVGVGNFRSSTLLKKLNAGNYDAVPAELMKWVKSKGKRMQGLVNRRSAEAGLWARGSFIQSAGSPVDKERAPLLSAEAMSAVGAVTSTGVLSFVPTTGPIAYALAFLVVISVCVGGYFYVRKRMAN